VCFVCVALVWVSVCGVVRRCEWLRMCAAVGARRHHSISGCQKQLIRPRGVGAKGGGAPASNGGGGGGTHL